MRERGVQSRQAKTRRVEAAIRRPGPPPPPRSNPWQVVAIIALIAAAAGWTTVAVVATRSPTTAAVESASPDDSFDPEATDEPIVPPVGETHDAPELEALLPRELKGTVLDVQSWTGDSILLENDTWSTSIRTFLTAAGKVPKDLRGAVASDPNQVLEESLKAYRGVGVSAEALRDALVAAWRVDYPDLVVTQVTLDGRSVTKLDFAEDTVDSYMYLRDDVVFEVETSDDALAVAALAALPAAGASGVPAPSASVAPGPSTSPS